MANLLTFTEDFSNAVWNTNGAIAVTTDTTLPPAVYGSNATLADTVADNSAAAQGNIFQQVSKSSGETNPYFGSLHILKDADTSRFVEFNLQFRGVSTIGCAARINTSTGSIVSYIGGGDDAPLDQGVVDAGLYWRFWIKYADTLSNTAVRLVFFPAITNTSISNGADSSVTGSIIPWGANVTRSDTLLQYEPDPFYDFVSPAMSVHRTQRTRPAMFRPGLAR